MDEQNQGQNLTKHERRRLKKEEQGKELMQLHKKQKIKKWLILFVSALVLGAGIIGLISWGKRYAPEQTFTNEPVHWHGHLSMYVCGKERSLKHLGDDQHHEGLALLHTHGDDTIHIEGRVIKKEDITLAKFFEAIDVPFGQSRFMDKVDGDCNDGNPDTLKVNVTTKDGITLEVSDPWDYSVSDGDEIEIRFE